jgi:2-oxoglutarate ferredoxin oxidoreductase subunit beta
MNTFGFHTIHGRAPAGSPPASKPFVPISKFGSRPVTVTRSPSASNHTIHMLRRNVGLKVLLFNNRIYGLTKGQYSPTSELGKKAKSTPYGSLDRPFNPISLAIGAEATFVARSVDVFQSHLKDTLKHAAAHKGSAFVEILQNCNIFNDGAWTGITEKDARSEQVIQLEHGRPLIFGKNRDKGIRRTADGDSRRGIAEADLIIHGAHPRRSMLSSYLTWKIGRLPGSHQVLRSWGELPRYEDLVNQRSPVQINAARAIWKNSCAVATPGGSKPADSLLYRPCSAGLQACSFFSLSFSA